MKRQTRLQKAQETLDIIAQGYYTVNGTTVSVAAQVERSVAQSLLYGTETLDTPDVTSLLAKRYATEVIVENGTVLEAVAALAAKGGRTGCLNFASAKNPGGGFLNGAKAQEESIALSSTLYPTLMRHFSMYEYNRSRSTYLYSDQMIYSPDVLVIRDDSGELLEQPYTISVITSPATNVGAMINNKPAELEQVAATMLRRMDKVLSVFLAQGMEHLLLGAWGCGVFQNDPVLIASLFAQLLCGQGKYAGAFKTLLFAVYDRSKEQENINAFINTFKPYEQPTEKEHQQIPEPGAPASAG